MSQRNPMNDRYQTDEHQGQTRKSAAAMKPKSKAATSVHMQSTQKTKQQKKAEQKAARTKQTSVDRQYYNPPTAQYKKLRKIWWGLLIAAIALTALSFAGRPFLPEVAVYIALGLAYACIIGALYVDFSRIRKVRRAYQEEMMSKKTKEMRAEEKKLKAAERTAKLDTAEKGTEAEAAETPKKRGLFGSGFSLKKAEDKKAEKQAAKEVQSAQKADAEDASKADKESSVIERARADAQNAEDKVSSAKDSAK